jgi:hypothetical protein
VCYLLFHLVGKKNESHTSAKRTPNKVMTFEPTKKPTKRFEPKNKHPRLFNLRMTTKKNCRVVQLTTLFNQVQPFAKNHKTNHWNPKSQNQMTCQKYSGKDL